MQTTQASNSFVTPLPRIIDPELAADIEKQSVYISEGLSSLKVSNNLSEVVVHYKHNADIEALRSKLSRFLEAMLQKFRRIEPTVHYQRSRKKNKIFEQNVFEQLIQHGWVFKHGQGSVSFSGPALKLLNVVDDYFKNLYQKKFLAVDQHYPTMINANLLARCGYFAMHPNAVSFVSHLPNDFDEIEAFRKMNEDQGHLKITHSHAFAAPDHCLNPAACFPCYEKLEGQKIASTGQILTWPGRVFRYESSNTIGLDRLWEFNVRELVFIGTDEFVQEGRKQAVSFVKNIVEEWDLDCHIETATDPFFATVYASRTFWQEAMDVKYEIRLNVEPGTDKKPRTIAAGSINLHGAFFGDRFNIRDHLEKPAYSGCVGMGLERWVLALFTQHGLKPDRWPANLKSKIFN